MDAVIENNSSYFRNSEDAKKSPRISSRLDGVKMACFDNLESLRTDFPNKRAALVTFSDHVKYYGDCTRTEGLFGGPLLDTKNSGRGAGNLVTSFFKKLSNRLTSMFVWRNSSAAKNKYSASTNYSNDDEFVVGKSQSENELNKSSNPDKFNVNLPHDILINR
jgi:hypothetical protein